MGGFDEVAIEVIVGKHRAADWRHADCVLTHTHFIQYFSDQAVGNTVRAPRAVVG